MGLGARRCEKDRLEQPGGKEPREQGRVGAAGPAGRPVLFRSRSPERRGQPYKLAPASATGRPHRSAGGGRVGCLDVRRAGGTCCPCCRGAAASREPVGGVGGWWACGPLDPAPPRPVGGPQGPRAGSAAGPVPCPQQAAPPPPRLARPGPPCTPLSREAPGSPRQTCAPGSRAGASAPRASCVPPALEGGARGAGRAAGKAPGHVLWAVIRPGN